MGRAQILALLLRTRPCTRVEWTSELLGETNAEPSKGSKVVD